MHVYFEYCCGCHYQPVLVVAVCNLWVNFQLYFLALKISLMQINASQVKGTRQHNGGSDRQFESQDRGPVAFIQVGRGVLYVHLVIKQRLFTHQAELAKTLSLLPFTFER